LLLLLCSHESILLKFSKVVLMGLFFLLNCLLLFVEMVLLGFILLLW
jgi:hypothetical protein